MTGTTAQPQFIGRERELEQLVGHAVEGAAGRGGTVFVPGPPGIGKDWLLDRFRDVATARPELEDAEFVSVYCSPNANDSAGWEPFGEILQRLASETDRARDRRKAVLQVVHDFGPDLLGLIPGLGGAIGRVAKAGSEMLLEREEGRRAAVSVDVPSQFEQTFLNLARQHKPLVILVRQAHWIGRNGASLLVRLVRQAPTNPLVIVLAHIPVDQDHPLVKVVQAEVGGMVEVLELAGFTEEEIRSYVSVRFGAEVAAALQPWLRQFADESPLFMAAYLGLLESGGIVAASNGGYALAPGWEAQLAILPRPENVTKLLAERLSGLDGTDLQLLRLGSVQGEQFLSAVIAQLSKTAPDDVLGRLERIEERLRVVRFNAFERTAGGRDPLYNFKPGGVQQLLYEQVKDPRRSLVHAEIAAILEKLMEGEAAPATKWVVEIARHHQEAGEPLAAAQAFYRAADALFNEGVLDEATRLSTQALDLVRGLEEGVEEHARLHAEVVDLLLSAIETTWRPGAEAGGVTLTKLAEEGEAAAAGTADLVLQARLRFARGRLLVSIESTAAGLTAMREALALAERSGDAITRLVILIHLGHHVDSEDLPAGRELLRQAEAIAGQLQPPPGAEGRLLQTYLHRLEAAVGVAEFDLGHYGPALEQLGKGIDGLRRVKSRERLSWALTFLAQLYTATGLYEESEKALTEAIGLFDGETAAIGVRGYARILLGKLYLEWGAGGGRDAETPIRAGWEESRGAGLISTIPLARNTYAEWLVEHAGRTEADLAEAEAGLDETIAASTANGWHRAAIAALALRGRAALLGEPRTPALVERALAASTESVEYLDRLGGSVPTVRTEEVLYRHHLALLAAGRPEAGDALERARGVVRQKADSIADPRQKEAFLTRVGLSRAILGT